MNEPAEIVARKPAECSDALIGDFVCLVLAGGEVTSAGLERRVRSSASLVFLTVGGCLSGVAALKRPDTLYRTRVSSNSGIKLTDDQVPFELGWVFIMPSARGTPALPAAGARCARMCRGQRRVRNVANGQRRHARRPVEVPICGRGHSLGLETRTLPSTCSCALRVPRSATDSRDYL